MSLHGTLAVPRRSFPGSPTSVPEERSLHRLVESVSLRYEQAVNLFVNALAEIAMRHRSSGPSGIAPSTAMDGRHQESRIRER